MQPAQMPNPRASRPAPVTVGILIIAAVALLVLIFVAAMGYRAISMFGSMGHFPVESRQANHGPEFYHTLADSIPASHDAAKNLVDLSHQETLTVLKNRLEKDPDRKGYLEFGYRYTATRGFDIGFAGSHESGSGSFTTEVAPNHMYFTDFRGLKVGQHIVFEEIPTNNLPTEKLTLYNADPYLFVRPIAVR